MYVFFDTETTGLPRSWKAPVTDIGNWPRLVQIAWLVYDNDGNELREANFIVCPVGFTIPPDSALIHGITTERALLEGTPLTEILEHFEGELAQADFVVAHNMNFDEKIVGAEFLRMNMPNILETKGKICTMESTKNFCAIDGQYGYKWPKLSELHYELFGTDFTEAHNAKNDIAATARCFWELRKQGVL